MTKDELTQRIEEAYSVLRRLPDADRKYRLPKLTSWPIFVREFVEAYGWSDVKMRLPPPSPESIDRAEELLGWFATHLNAYPKGARALWLTYGRGLSLAQTGVVLNRTKGNVAKLRETALKLLLTRLHTPSLARSA